VSGVTAFNEQMGSHTTYRVGGSVASFTTLSSTEDLLAWENPAGHEVRVVGNGSNLLVADGTHDIAVLHCAGALAEVRWSEHDGGVTVVAGAGMDLPRAARLLAADGISGFGWAVGVPGTFGGAVAMNAGGHGSDMAASVTSVTLWRSGALCEIAASELAFGYRTSAISEVDIVLSVTLELQRGDVAVEAELLRSIVRWRREHQPGGANAGSVFRNPPGDSAGRLIDAVGARGLRIGSAVVSPKHANFIIADRDGAANDVYSLMRVVRQRVFDETGLWLQPETKLWGFEEAL